MFVVDKGPWVPVAIASGVAALLLVILLILFFLYDPFVRLVGDVPYGLTPTTAWYTAHGGPPAWLGESSAPSLRSSAIAAWKRSPRNEGSA